MAIATMLSELFIKIQFLTMLALIQLLLPDYHDIWSMAEQQTNGFTKEGPSFRLSFNLVQYDTGKTLVIQGLQLQTMNSFTLQINQYDIILNLQLENHFKCPTHMYREIANNFRGATIKTKILQISMKSGNDYDYEFQLPLEKQQQNDQLVLADSSLLSQLVVLKHRAAWQQKQISAILKERESTVRQLRQQKSGIQRRIEELKRMKNRYPHNSSKTGKVKTKPISKVLNSSFSKAEQANTEPKPLAVLPKVTTYLSSNITCHQMQSFIPHNNHPSNIHSFAVSGPKMEILQKISPSQHWLNFILESPVQQSSIYSMKIELPEAQSRQIVLGVVNAELIGFEGDCRCTIGLDCSNGDVIMLWMQVGKAQRCEFGPMDVIRVEVDTVMDVIRWYYCGEMSEEKIAEVSIPQELQSMYLAVSMKDRKSRVKLIGT